MFVAWAGAPWAFVVNAVSFLVSAATVAAIRVDAPRAPRVGMLAELREGWHEVTSRSWLLAGLLAATAYHAAFGAVTVLVDVIAVRDLGGPTALGWISAASGAGGLVGRPPRPAYAAAPPAVRRLALRGADVAVRGGVRLAGRTSAWSSARPWSPSAG